MRMVFLCGHCRGKLAADSSHAGTPVKCPRCAAVIECPAPEDPGGEASGASRRKSSRRVAQDDRPIRRAKRTMSGGVKVALIAVAGLALVGAVVLALLLASRGGAGAARNGNDASGVAGIPVEDQYPAAYLRDAPPPEYEEHRFGRARVFLSGHIWKHDSTSSRGEGRRKYSGAGTHLLLGQMRNFHGLEEPDDWMIERACAIAVAYDSRDPVAKLGEKRIAVSGYSGREVRLRVGSRKVIVRSVVADGVLYSMAMSTFFDDDQLTERFEVASGSFAITR